MQKSIHIEESSDDMVRVLSITDPIEGLVIEGREYILIDNYEEEPILPNNMTVNYAFYTKSTGAFKWVQVVYQATSDDYNKNIEELKETITTQANMISSLQSRIRELQQYTEESQNASYEALAVLLESSVPTDIVDETEGNITEGEGV